MRVRIEIGADNSLKITGFANGQDFNGFLVFQKESPIESFNDRIRLELDSTDECWINGVWYNPCPEDPPPTGSGGGGDQVESEAGAN